MSYDSVGELELLYGNSAGRVARMSLSSISPAGDEGEKEWEACCRPLCPSSSLTAGGISTVPGDKTPVSDIRHTPLSVPELSSVTPETAYFILRSLSYIRREHKEISVHMQYLFIYIYK